MATIDEQDRCQQERLEGHLLHPITIDTAPEANIEALILRERLCIEVSLARQIDHAQHRVWAIRKASIADNYPTVSHGSRPPDTPITVCRSVFALAFSRDNRFVEPWGSWSSRNPRRNAEGE